MWFASERGAGFRTAWAATLAIHPDASLAIGRAAQAVVTSHPDLRKGLKL
jgi:hypothetical protein